jgi:predicted esterase
MEKITYNQLLNQTLDLYRIEHYKEAYDFIAEQGPLVGGNQAQIYNFRYSIACKAGLFDLAMADFEEAVEKLGFWYSYNYLITDEDLIDLRQNLRFKELAEICKKRKQVAHLNVAPVLKIIQPSKKNNLDELGSPGLLVALHGNQENAEIAEPYWASVIDQGYVLALPQSSQIEFSDAYDWDDIEKGAGELKQHMDNIMTTQVVDPNNIIIGTFSAGAGAALYAILHDMIQVKSLIFVAPWLPEIDTWAPLLDVLKTKNITCHIICGDLDEDCLESSQSFVKLLKKRQVPYTLKLIENLDHDFPKSFDQDLAQLISL